MVSHDTASSSTDCIRDKPPFSFDRGQESQDSTMWNIVWVSPQGHRSVSVSRHFLLQALQCPCSVRKRFSKDNCCRGTSKPGCWIVRSHTRWELTTWADFQLCLHRLLMSTGCKSSHSGFLDVSRSNGGLRISGWIGQLSCLTIFSTSLSVAGFLHRADGSMLESTGSHGRGVERRIPEMRRMVKLFELSEMTFKGHSRSLAMSSFIGSPVLSTWDWKSRLHLFSEKNCWNYLEDGSRSLAIVEFNRPHITFY